VIGLLVAGIYRVRVGRIAQEFNVRLEERLAERNRVARDLHDTLLQSFQGVSLLFQAVSNRLSPGETKQKLDSAIDQAREAINEGRQAVQGLRASTIERNDLADVIKTLGEGLAADPIGQNPAVFRVAVVGESRNLHPIVRDEVYRIVGEGLRNAFRHANAKRIEVDILYDERRLRVLVRDDGKGIDPKCLSDDRREGHYGLRGSLGEHRSRFAEKFSGEDRQ
jgi:signal transduction histidine kinase